MTQVRAVAAILASMDGVRQRATWLPCAAVDVPHRGAHAAGVSSVATMSQVSKFRRTRANVGRTSAGRRATWMGAMAFVGEIVVGIALPVVFDNARRARRHRPLTPRLTGRQVVHPESDMSYQAAE